MDEWSGSLCKRKTITAFLRNKIQFEYEEIYETFNCFDTFYLTQFIAVISKASEARKRDKVWNPFYFFIKLDLCNSNNIFSAFLLLFDFYQHKNVSFLEN